MTENLNSTRATVAAMMLKTVEDGGAEAAAILSTLDGEEVAAYLITALSLGAEMVEVETRVLREHGVAGGVVLAYLARLAVGPVG